MRLRTFIAADMAEAIDQVRRELGPEAIIVSNFINDAGRMEVTAAIESRPKMASPSHPASLPDIEASLEQMLRDRLRAGPLPRRDHADASPQPTAPVHSGISFDETLIATALDAQGVPPSLRDALVAAATALGSDDALAALAHAFEVRFSFEPVPTHPQAPIMLVGLPGSGKTVTMAKLAANALIGGASVDLITTDSARAGAAAQSEAYGKLLDVAVHPAANLDELSILLDERAEARSHRSASVCFIDTTGVNPFDCGEFDALRRLADGAHLVAGVEPVLVLSAAGDALVLSEAAGRFAELGVRRLIVTQLDIARRLGPTLAAADRAGFALAQLSVTPYLARGLASMNSLVCARLILDTRDRRADTPVLAAV
ncbi:hypothetical protein [Parvibaculum sp.]|uniref:flagellar biosynthesis protein FlhF n=1 Tax=Parvibaculum sp. TaxID=2024848 RepID=UPI002B89D1E7|nr:hypothetical protein [Parvibaculum sp.]HUD51284.1 hypothetical protein [Parvibaculum sp.]